MSDKPIDPNAAVDFMCTNARKYGEAKAKRRYLEEFRKTKKALLMGQCTEKAVNAREQFAYAHEEYQAVLTGLEASIEQEETLAWLLKAAEIRVDIWRSQEASNRTIERATR